MAEISTTSWNNFPALVLESEMLRVVIVPDLGAKIVSLYDKLRGREWLAAPMRQVQQTVYGVEFVSQDMSGWDEMLPTIDACTWQGLQLPDHGEVWSIPWHVESGEAAVITSVAGVALPYVFTRAAELITPNCLELRYSLVNHGKQAFPYLWAAHPQFLADPHTRILLPASVQRVVNIIDGDPRWGEVGSLYAWPAAVSVDGESLRLDCAGAVEKRACRKFYLPPNKPVSWAALVDENLGCQLRMDWSPSELPYVGLWVDEGMYNSVPVVALEPSNGYYDSLERAVLNKKISVLDPQQVASWTLRITTGS
jgi:galactose mutarotase-like enzyme